MAVWHALRQRFLSPSSRPVCIEIADHAGTGAASDHPAVSGRSCAECARTLVYMARIGSPSTQSRT